MSILEITVNLMKQVIHLWNDSKLRNKSKNPICKDSIEKLFFFTICNKFVWISFHIVSKFVNLFPWYLFFYIYTFFFFFFCLAVFWEKEQGCMPIDFLFSSDLSSLFPLKGYTEGLILLVQISLVNMCVLWHLSRTIFLLKFQITGLPNCLDVSKLYLLHC